MNKYKINSVEHSLPIIVMDSNINFDGTFNVVTGKCKFKNRQCHRTILKNGIMQLFMTCHFSQKKEMIFVMKTRDFQLKFTLRF